MPNIKELRYKTRLHVTVNPLAGLCHRCHAKLRPPAMLLVMITMTKSIHGFPLNSLSYMGVVLRLATFCAATALLLKKQQLYLF